MKRIDIVLPVYNEEMGLEHFDSTLRETLDKLRDRYSFTMIYVVDKCKDNSYKVVEKLAEKYNDVTGLQLSNRFGHQNSLMAGFSVSGGDAVVMMDCDLEHPPSLIPEMLEHFENGFHIVYTERTYNQKVGVFKRMSSKLFYSVINMFSAVPIKESSADFRLISADVRKALVENMTEQNPFLRGILPWMGFSHISILYCSQSRLVGESSYTLHRMVKFGLNGIVSFSNKPLYITIYIGLFFALLSLLYLAYLVFEYFLGNIIIQGWLTTIVFIGFMGSIQLIALGIIGLYIGKIFEEAKGRPIFIIENSTNKKIDASHT